MLQTPKRIEYPYLCSSPLLLSPTCFYGAKPPTVEDVFLMFRSIHTSDQVLRHGQFNSSKESAADKTAVLLESWWLKTNIPLKQRKNIICAILTLNKTWTTLFKKRNLETQSQKDKRCSFQASLKETFWAVSPGYENSIALSSDPRLVNNRMFLNNMREDRKGSLGPVDTKLEAREARKVKTSLQAKKLAEKRKIDTADVVYSSGTEEHEGSDGDSDDEYTPPRVERKRRNKTLLEDLSLVADKYQMSHRCLTEVQGVALKVNGKDLKNESVSCMTTKRTRDAMRGEASRGVFTKQYDKVSGKFTLHWDGKHLKHLTHTSLPEERVAILVVGDGEEILLGIPKVCDVSIGLKIH